MIADSEPKFVSASEMARRAGVTLDRFLKGVHRKLIVPDVTPAANMMLFDIAKLPSVKRILSKG